MASLENFRAQKDRFFGHDPHSPLLPEQKDQFEGLHYFDPNPDLAFELTLEPFEKQDRITMQTSTGDVQDYIRWGRIAFTVNQEPAELTVYMSVGIGGGFFLPFMDATNGEETYTAGRYLEIEPLDGNRFEVDFNMAYNPYCAYNEYWSCPIPPKENRLKVRIEAGEKAFKQPTS